MPLRFKLLFPLVIASLVALGYIEMVWSPRSLESAKQEYLKDAGRHLDTVVEGLVPLMLTNQLDVIQANLDELGKKNEDWQSILLTDRQGRQLYPLRFAGGGPQPIVDTNVQVLAKDIRLLNSDLGKLVIRVAYGSRLDEVQRQQRQLKVMLVVIILLMALTWMSTLEAAVVQPLKRLSKAATELARKNFEVPLPGRGGDEVGKLIGSFAAMRDDLRAYRDDLLREIGVRIQAEADLRRFKAIIDSSDDAIIGKSLDGIITSWNRGAERIFGYTAEEAIGQPVQFLIPSGGTNEEPSILVRLARGESVAHFETVRKHKDGRLIDISATISPVLDEDGKVIGASKIARDITQRKQDEAELAKYRDHLEKLVEERTIALSVAKELAEAANSAKSEFLANMSHEIRTPMNAVIGMTHLALQTALTDQQRDYLQKAKIAADSLLGIINDILDFSKIEAGKLAMESMEFLLEDVFDRVTHVLGTKAAEKQLEFMLDVAPDVPPCLVGDALRLGQVLVNLGSNAIKFTETGEIIAVTVAKAKPEGDRVILQFSVRDTGIGMTPEQVRLLFQPFSQVDSSSTRRFSGTGLGLAISKHLVELMGGEIWVESEPGRGSEFFFTAVFGIGREPQARTAQPFQDLTGLKVLIVDDSPNAREILKNLVTNLGFRAVTASSAMEGLAALEQGAFDLVLMDWRMPEVDGFEAARRIRRDARLPVRPRIIMVTAYGDESVPQRVKQEGLDGYLPKPLTPSTLFDAVMSAFGRMDPQRTPRTGGKGPLPSPPPQLQGAQVLLVEDNDFNQQVATDMLTLMGVDVTLAANGQEALDLIRTRTFDAVLMDIQMPVMDGYEATRRLRSDPANTDLPILAMTAHAMAREQKRCLDLGMNDYISKPINPEAFSTTLAKWIRHGDGSKAELPAQAIPLATGMASSPGVDLPDISPEACQTYFGGRRDAYENALRKFLQLHTGTAEKIRASLARGDRESAEMTAHSMISGAGVIGASGLSAIALQLQDAIQSGAPGSMDTLLNRFEEQLATIIKGLKVHCGLG
jgi:PAS domain S-box-containing protein